MSNEPVDYERVLAAMQQAASIIQQRPHDSARARYSYYNASAAEEAMTAIDTVLASGQKMIWPAQGVALTTLYLKWRQGIQFIRERMPEHADYLDKLNLLKVTRIPKVGLQISPEPKPGALALYIKCDWKRELEEFIDNCQPPDAFERIGIPISDDDVLWVNSILAPVRHLFIVEIPEDKSKILLIRYTAPQVT